MNKLKRRKIKKILKIGLSITAVFGFLGAIGLIYLFATVKPPKPAENRPGSVKYADAGEMWQLVNDQRTANGLPALVLDPKLNESAAAKCSDMVARNYYGHYTPEGQYFNIAMNKFAPGYIHYGENINMAYGGTAVYSSGGIVSSWMNSPGHRENILKLAYTNVGYAVCSSDNFAKYGKAEVVVQHFVGP